MDKEKISAFIKQELTQNSYNDQNIIWENVENYLW